MADCQMLRGVLQASPQKGFLSGLAGSQRVAISLAKLLTKWGLLPEDAPLGPI